MRIYPLTQQAQGRYAVGGILCQTTERYNTVRCRLIGWQSRSLAKAIRVPHCQYDITPAYERIVRPPSPVRCAHQVTDLCRKVTVCFMGPPPMSLEMHQRTMMYSQYGTHGYTDNRGRLQTPHAAWSPGVARRYELAPMLWFSQGCAQLDYVRPLRSQICLVHWLHASTRNRRK